MKTAPINHHLSDLLGFKVQKDLGMVVSKDYNLSVCLPDVARYWHPTKNILLPSEVTPSSQIKVFWQCPGNPSHEWVDTPADSARRKKMCHFCNGITIRDRESRWLHNLEQLKQFVEQNNRWPTLKSPEEKHLWTWANAQRCRKDNLSKTRLSQLLSWSWWKWDVLSAKFEKNMVALRNYVDQHGEPPTVRSSVNTFCCNARSSYRKNKLTSQQILELESISGWKWHYEDKWEESFQLLQKWVKDHHQLPRSRGSSKTSTLEKRLTIFVERQRDHYKHKSRFVGKDRRLALEGLPGWSWDISLNKKWNSSFDRLQRFIDKNKQLPKWDSVEHLWIKYQHKRYKNKTMPLEQVEKLSTLTGWQWE